MKLVKFKRIVNVSNQSYNSGTGQYTLTTSAAHLLNVGDTFTIMNTVTSMMETVTCLAGTTGSTVVFAFAWATAIWGSTFYVYNFPAAFSGNSEIETHNGTISTFQATTTTSSGTGSHNISFQFSNDKVGWITVANSTPSGTSPVTDGFALQAPWMFVRVNVTSIVGTGAVMTVSMAGERM